MGRLATLPAGADPAAATERRQARRPGLQLEPLRLRIAESRIQAQIAGIDRASGVEVGGLVPPHDVATEVLPLLELRIAAESRSAAVLGNHVALDVWRRKTREQD